MIILVLLFLTTINSQTQNPIRTNSTTPPPVIPSYVTNFTSPRPDPDFPGWTPSIMVLSSCSYIIPMDFNYQGCDNPNEPEIGRINSACDICPPLSASNSYTCSVFTNPDFNLFAYGLVNHLLWSDIPVKWIIKTNKQHNDYDIKNAQTIIVYPPRLASSADINTALEAAKPRNFSGGPFAVDTQFTQYADPFIVNYTLTVGEVRVFMTSENINVDVRYTLLTRPYVAVLASSNEQFILEAVLMSAGFQKGLHWEEMTKEEARDKLGNGTCITMAMEPHFHACQDQDPTSSYTSNSAAFVSAARAVLNLGSNFYAMCGGINTYEQCDNEDGTSCSLCSQLDPDATGCQNCQEDNSYPIPCRNGDVFGQKCVNVTVGNTPFGGFRQHALCQPEEPGYFYGRYNPILTNRYCPDGFFMTENVANSSYGGFQTPSYYLTQINDHTVFHDMAPDIPFNQWLGDWDYETNSSVRYLSLWNSLADGIPINQQTKLRTSTWAHFTIAEENNARDNTVKVGYPYGIYYAAHAKLSQFQGGKGGNIFYVAGHHYTADNRQLAKAGYIMTNATGSFGGSACVEAGVAYSYDVNGNLMSGPATSLGGGCFNRPGRRMLLNAVMTPSNLTCNVPRTVCSNGACQTVTVSLQVDACKAFGVCGGSGFKRNINIVSSTQDNSTTTAACAAANIKCTCLLKFDCCGVCGGDGTSCVVVDNPYADMNGQQVGTITSVTVDGKVQTGIIGIVTPTANPPQPPVTLSMPVLTDTQAANIISVSPGLFASIPPDGISASISTIQGTSVSILLSNVPSDIPTTLAAIAAAAASIGVPSSRITVSYNPQTQQVTITFGTLSSPSTDTPTNPSSNSSTTSPSAPTPFPSLTNLTGTNTPHGENINLEADQCVQYTYTIIPQIVSASLFVSIQTISYSGTPPTLTVYLKKDDFASETDYDCKSPTLDDNNEYSFIWLNDGDTTSTGTFWGSSLSIPQQNTCGNKLLMEGTWYFGVCAGPAPVSFSFQASFVLDPKTNNAQSPTSDANTHTFFSGWLVHMILLWYYFSN